MIEKDSDGIPEKHLGPETGKRTEFTFADLQTMTVAGPVVKDEHNVLMLPLRLRDQVWYAHADFMVEAILTLSICGGHWLKFVAWLRHLDLVQYAVLVEAKHKLV